MTDDDGAAAVTEPLHRFGRDLVRLVRDRAVADARKTLHGVYRGPTAARWRRLIDEASSPAAAVEELLPDLIDAALVELLHAVDQGELELLVRDRTDGTLLDLGHHAGELVGWYVGTYDGWCKRFSTEPFADLYAPTDDGTS